MMNVGGVSERYELEGKKFGFQRFVTIKVNPTEDELNVAILALVLDIYWIQQVAEPPITIE
jgi:hypothetical protein